MFYVDITLCFKKSEVVKWMRTFNSNCRTGKGYCSVLAYILCTWKPYIQTWYSGLGKIFGCKTLPKCENSELDGPMI